MFVSKCQFCGSNIPEFHYCDSVGNACFYNCEICGRYIVSEFDILANKPLYDNKALKSYLFYNKQEKKNYFIGTVECYKSYKTNKANSTAILVTEEMVENWYPKTFAERIDRIIMWLAEHSQCIGDAVKVNSKMKESLFFLVKNLDGSGTSDEYSFIVNYMKDMDLITDKPYEKFGDQKQIFFEHASLGYTLTAKAWEKVYDMQKSKSNNKNAFVAMKFGEETRELREKIKEGLSRAGYEARIMDEIEHNRQIVPEMLHEIKNSRFVIAELSHHNNGAYYEAGYALGLGKEVIHICQKSELSNGLHFDVSQVNTVVYEDIDEIPEKLRKRIEATIL